MPTFEEENWYRKFHEGTFLVKGWRTRTEELLAQWPPTRQEELRERLQRLGEKIGREWARENQVRRIDTASLQRWGGQLSQACQHSMPQLLTMLETIEQEVDQLLS